MTIAKKRLTWYTKQIDTNKTKLYQHHTIKQEATFLNMKLYKIAIPIQPIEKVLAKRWISAPMWML